jgi:hypothetical protein
MAEIVSGTSIKDTFAGQVYLSNRLETRAKLKTDS